MKKKISIILTVFTVAILMVFSINVFSQEKQAQPEDSTSKAMIDDNAMLEECMDQMDSDMMGMCSQMMAKMKESSSMCCNMMDKEEMKGDKPEKGNPSDESKEQREVPENKG